MGELNRVLRERALAYLMRHNVTVPTRRETKKATARINTFTTELRRHPGDSRSVVLDRIKAIASPETGCQVATESELGRIGQLGQRQGRTTVVRKF